MTFLDFLIKNESKKIFVDPCNGNNGDLLIWNGMEEALRKAGIKRVSDISEAEIIIVNGGGMFIDAYKQGIEKIKNYSILFPNIPLCIAPNSFYFKTVDFGAVLDLRKSPLLLFCRERYSKKYIDELIKGKDLVTSYLDHDLAFHLTDSKQILELKNQYPTGKVGNVLVVDRMDIEHASVGGKPGVVNKLYASFIPEFLKKYIREYRFKKRNASGTKLTKIGKELILKNNENYLFNNIETSDISRIDICNFDTFAKKIAEAEFIITNRLHVGVLGHLLGRNVYMVEGSYHKMTGIYELSMAESSTTNILKCDNV